MTVIIDGTKGTTTPGLYSSTTFTGTYSDGIVVDYTTGMGRISVGPADGLAFYNAGVATTELMRLSSAGYLGIGTNSPATFLHVYGTSTPYLKVQDATSFLNVGVNTVDSGYAFYNSGAGHSFLTATGTTEAMRITSAGNVGIGVNSPNAKLEISSAGEAIRISGSTTLAYIRSSASGANQWFIGSGGNAGLQLYTYTATPITFTVAGGTEAARFDTSSCLLIGTQTNVSSVGRLTTVQAGTGNAGAAISADATDANYTYNIAYLNAGRAATSAFNFIKCTSGNYGVTQFQVSGNGVVYAQNTTIQSLSDARVKENVRDSDEGLQVILGVKTRRFDFKDGFGNDRKNVLGFIAQEMEEVFPDAVSELPFDPDGDGPEEPYKSVGPGALIPVLVKAIQEQQVIIEQLRADVALLKGQA